MKARRTFERITRKTEYELPAAINREIGRVIVRWTYLEHYIQRMIWAIAFNADAKGAALGRIAIREPGSNESRIDLLECVADVRNIGLDAKLLRELKAECRAISEKRNLIAHGLWTNVPGTGWVVQQTRGAWQDYKDGPTGNKRITPEAVPMTSSDLRALTDQIDRVIKDVRNLKGTIGEP